MDDKEVPLPVRTVALELERVAQSHADVREWPIGVGLDASEPEGG